MVYSGCPASPKSWKFDSQVGRVGNGRKLTIEIKEEIFIACFKNGELHRWSVIIIISIIKYVPANSLSVTRAQLKLTLDFLSKS